jgi:hypothetical protein
MATVQPGRRRQIGPRSARYQVPADDPVMGGHGLRPSGTVGARVVQGPRAPDPLARTMPRGVVDGHRARPTPAGGPFLGKHPNGLALDGLMVPGTVRRQVLQHPPAGFQPQSGQDWRPGVLLSAQHHASHPRDQPDPPRPGEAPSNRGQQSYPGIPEMSSLLHEAPSRVPPCLAYRNHTGSSGGSVMTIQNPGNYCLKRCRDRQLVYAEAVSGVILRILLWPCGP